MSEANRTKPLVLLLTFDKSELYMDMYKDFTRLLKEKADVQHITTPSEARSAFASQPRPRAVLSADESFTSGTRTSLVQEALSYVRSGGILIFMGLFSSFSRPPAINKLFSTLGLAWRTGDYHRTTFELNPGMTHFNTDGMAGRYSQKALHLASVANQDAVYLPFNASRIESRVFGESPVGDMAQAPATFTKVGQGMVGYVGDVNNEDETTPLVLRMCGLQ